MSRLSEMLESGIAPGLCGSMAHQDPTSADVSVPKAIRKCFDTTYRHKKGQRPIREEEVFKAIGYDKNTLKRTWKNL